MLANCKCRTKPISTLADFVNKQNFRYRQTKILLSYTSGRYAATKLPCGFAESSHHVIGPYFFDDVDNLAFTVTSIRKSLLRKNYRRFHKLLITPVFDKTDQRHIHHYHRWLPYTNSLATV